MKRFVETSVGRVELDTRKVKVGGLSVTITVFGDDGWESLSHTWGEGWEEGKTLDQALVERAGLAPDEAEQVAADTLREWKERGGEEEYEKESREVVPFLGVTFGLAALGIAALLAAGVWLVTRIV